MSGNVVVLRATVTGRHVTSFDAFEAALKQAISETEGIDIESVEVEGILSRREEEG